MQVFSRSSVNGLSVWQIVDAGGWILSEGPSRGVDASGALAMLKTIGGEGHATIVSVSSIDALLVHEDGRGGASLRPYGLYWFDGFRDMSLEAPANSADVIDFARSLYCAASLP